MTDKVILGEWAQRLLEDDYFKQVLSDLKNNQVELIIGTDNFDIDARENAYRNIKAIDLLVGHLQGLSAETQIRAKRFKVL